MALLIQLTATIVVLLHFTAAAPAPTHGENRSARRRSSTSAMLPQESFNQPLSNRLTDLGSQEGLIFGSGEVFTTRHNETRQSRLVAEKKLRNVTSSQFNRTSGSQLNICTLEPSYLCLMEPVQPQRNKEMRLLAIKDMVLSQLGRSNKAPTEMTRMSSPNSLTRLNGEVPSSPFSGELQTFYASCDLPNKVGVETWTMPGFFHLFFNVSSGTVNPVSTTRQTRTSKGASPYPEYYPVNGRQQRKPVNVISAKLRLYKVGRGSQAKNDQAQNLTLSEPCNDTTVNEGLENISPSEMTKTVSNVDEKIRVSIYWYTMPATKHHYKKKLLDTKMLSLKDSEWIDFDIQKAVKAWLEKKLNYGLIVEVENEDNDLVDAKNYFSNIACPQITPSDNSNSTQSLEATAEPLPTAADIAVPVLEICTLSISNSVPYTDGDRQVEYPPFPFPVASVRPHHGRHQAESRVGNTDGFAWQNDGMADQPVTETHHHRRRHHHGDTNNRHSENQMSQRTPKPSQNSETTTPFRFDDDHPLRSIFSKPFLPSRRGSQQTTRQTAEELDYSDLESSEEKKQEDVHQIVIENVFVESPQNSGRTR